MCGNVYLTIWGKLSHWIGSKGRKENGIAGTSQL